MVVKRFGVMSVAKVYGALSAAMGLLFGLFVAAASALGMGLSEGDEPAIVAAMLGVGAVIFAADLLRIAGRRDGGALRALYNLFAGMVGGVRIDVETMLKAEVNAEVMLNLTSVQHSPSALQRPFADQHRFPSDPDAGDPSRPPSRSRCGCGSGASSRRPGG